MTTQDQTPDTVSRQAHDRITNERDDLKALLATAQGELSTVALERRAYDYFTEQKAPDAVALSRLAAPHLQDVAPEGIGEKLSALFPASMLATAPAPPAEPSTELDTPAAPAVPPVPAIGGPDPAAPGTVTLVVGARVGASGAGVLDPETDADELAPVDGLERQSAVGPGVPAGEFRGAR